MSPASPPLITVLAGALTLPALPARAAIGSALAPDQADAIRAEIRTELDHFAELRLPLSRAARDRAEDRTRAATFRALRAVRYRGPCWSDDELQRAHLEVLRLEVLVSRAFVGAGREALADGIPSEAELAVLDVARQSATEALVRIEAGLDALRRLCPGQEPARLGWLRAPPG